MRRLLVVTAVLTLLLAACADDGGDEESVDPPDTTEVDEQDDRLDQVVVFTPEDSEIDSYGEPTTWTPRFEHVLAAEAILAEHIEANPDLGLDPLETYVRQYLGVGEDDELISVSALCEDSLDTLDDWEDEFIVVNDGGTCFWQATVDLTTETIDPFTVNGNA